jgi:phage terminase Nu1 subunit (DNA packaging protein)
VTEDAPAKPKKRRSAELIVNLDELASICSVTPETMRTHLASAPADADWIAQRGRRGVGYKLKAEGAVAWWRGRSSETDSADDARRRQLAELRMQMLGGDAEESDLLLTGKQRREEFLAGQAELSYREAMGELVRAADVDAELANAAIELRRQLQEVGRVIRRKFGLDKDVETAIDVLIGTRLEAFVQKLDAVDEPSSGDPADGASEAGQPVPADAANADAAPVRKRTRSHKARAARAEIPGTADAVGSGEPPPVPKKPRRVQRRLEG